MIFITTFNKDIYEICGENLLQSFISTHNNDIHKLIVFFEDSTVDPKFYPSWLTKWDNIQNIHFVNILQDGTVLNIDKELCFKDIQKIELHKRNMPLDLGLQWFSWHDYKFYRIITNDNKEFIFTNFI